MELPDEDEKDELLDEIIENSRDTRKRLVSAIEELDTIEIAAGGEGEVLRLEAKGKLAGEMTRANAQLVEMYKIRGKLKSGDSYENLGLEIDKDVGQPYAEEPDLLSKQEDRIDVEDEWDKMLAEPAGDN